MNEANLINWFETQARPFLAKHAPDRLPPLESDFQRLLKLKAQPETITVCFLGNSGVGKSTLLNALAAGNRQILPSGGIGPLTAQATEVKYSEEPRFKVKYQPKVRYWQLVSALDFRLQHQNKAANRPKGQAETPTDIDVADDIKANLEQDDLIEAKDIATPPPPSETDADAIKAATEKIEALIKQAKHMVCGNQFSTRGLDYLVAALRLAGNPKPNWDQETFADDLPRLQRINEVLKGEKDSRTYERTQGNDKKAFEQDLTDHAAGFLSPLIERISVEWPSDILKSGIILVDLPGVGIASDSYRDVTRQYVREKARGVILVVDRAGPTEASVSLLRTSGYWDRLVGAADDPSSDPCSMMIAVTRVDDVTQTEWKTKRDRGEKVPRSEVFSDIVEQFKPRMKSQIVEQLGTISGATNEAVTEARRIALHNIIDGLQIHPVSAPEYQKILADDEEDKPFLKTEEATGIPGLQESLTQLATTERASRRAKVDDVCNRLSSAALTEIELVKASWEREDRAEAEAERLQDALKDVLAEKERELGHRTAAFHEFLKETVPAKIEALVLEAKVEAQIDVEAYLVSLSGAHWATLRAAVRRGGTYLGSTHINLPDDISSYFQGPMAAVWGQKLLKDIRARTGDLADDMKQLVAELCDWANEHGGATVNPRLLQAQQDRVAALAKQMHAVGKDAVNEMRDTVKNELTAVIRKPIKSKCESFVEKGDDIGPGVKRRILELFKDLAHQATKAASEPAKKILKENFADVRKDIEEAFAKGGKPLQDTADLIVERHESRVRRSDAQRRGAILAEVRSVLATHPTANGQTPAHHSPA